jgi:hypothetical protein
MSHSVQLFNRTRRESTRKIQRGTLPVVLNNFSGTRYGVRPLGPRRLLPRFARVGGSVAAHTGVAGNRAAAHRRAQSKPAPGSALRPGATCSRPNWARRWSPRSTRTTCGKYTSATPCLGYASRRRGREDRGPRGPATGPREAVIEHGGGRPNLRKFPRRCSVARRRYCLLTASAPQTERL